jgi:hypothetical protein
MGADVGAQFVEIVNKPLQFQAEGAGLKVDTTAEAIRGHVTFCHWTAPEFTDLGQTALHGILSVVAFAVALWSALEEARIFRMRARLAEGYAAIAEEEWMRFNARYRPLENDMIAECLADPLREPGYGEAESRYLELSARGFESARDRMAELARGYALCVDPSVAAGFALEEAAAEADAVNYGYRDAEWYARQKNDLRFSERAGLLNVGRDLMAQASKYGGMGDGILQGAAASARAATSGAMQYLGYIRNRQVTYYPEQVTGSSASSAYAGAASPGVASAMSVDTTAG